MFIFQLIFLHHVSKGDLYSTPGVTPGFTGAPAATGANADKQQVPLLACCPWGGKLVPCVG